MDIIFNKNNNGTAELVKALGMIDKATDYTKWEPYMPLCIRKLTAIVGKEVYLAAVKAYNENTETGDYDKLILYVQQSIALFAWHKITPTLDAQHGNSGRQKRLGEGEKGLTAAQEYKDETNILNLAYESVDSLIAFLDEGSFDFWENSEKKKSIDKLLIKSKSAFDQYYMIGSHRLYLTLIPIIREIQDRYIIPIITQNRFDKLLSGDTELKEMLYDICCRPLALLTMQKAIERLPVEVLPEGIVQIQIQGVVKDKLRAEAEARKAVAASLAGDAQKDLDSLQDIIAQIDAAPQAPDYYILKPSIQRKGVTF